jgi:hypothetical protein
VPPKAGTCCDTTEKWYARSCPAALPANDWSFLVLQGQLECDLMSLFFDFVFEHHDSTIQVGLMALAAHFVHYLPYIVQLLMANLQEKKEIKERFNLFQYKTVDFTLRLNIYKRKARDKTSTLADI